ncbi:transmembrane protein 255A isoform X2 [Protopterus annectens]|uniref:transmembrane protein 255A isoform X2 n=1 Tax=Protopterus annectens TaxID=7888 RepID=UPI001CFAD307|nr:transmembrane protein 255A isoform X2 [Protopterus annectens]
MRDSAGCRAHKSGGLVGMQPSLTQQQRTGGLTLPDSRGSFSRRKRNSVLVTVSLLIVSILILTVGLAATTRTQNVTVGGYYPGIILGFGSFLGIIGANLIENKRQMLVASIVFISFGVIAAFCCAIVDGVFAARHIDVRPLYAGRCQYHSKVTSYISDDHLSDVICQAFPRGPCSLKIKSNTCYCCDLYNCGSRMEILGGYYEYVDVSSCQDVIHLYHLLWSATILNIVGLFLGIITAAVLGGFKDMSPTAPTVTCPTEPAPPPATYNPRPQHSSAFLSSTPSGLSEDPQSVSQSASGYMRPSHAPPRYSPPYFPPNEKPPPYTP